MLYKLLPSSIIIITWTLLSTSTPTVLGLLVMMLAFLTTTMSLTLLPSWMSMIIFIVYVGGLLVMFSYFLAIQMNFLVKNKILTPTSLMTLMLWFSLLLAYSPLPPNSPSITSPHPTLLIAPTNSPTTILIALILLLILVIVVFMTHLHHSPLRPNR